MSLQLDRSSSVPLWNQLESILRARLDGGEFATRFPTDRELMESYGVSRHTARHAVAQLGYDGIVRRSRGIGTSVDEGTVAQTLGALYSLFHVVEEAGCTQNSDVVRLGTCVNEHAAQQLELSGDSTLVELSRVRHANGCPIAFDHVWLPFEFGAAVLDADFSHTALYDELEAVGSGRPSSGCERIRAVIPNAALRTQLELTVDDAAFQIERIGYLDDHPVEWRVTTIRSDMFNFVTDWRRGQRSETRLEQMIQVSSPRV